MARLVFIMECLHEESPGETAGFRERHQTGYRISVPTSAPPDHEAEAQARARWIDIRIIDMSSGAPPRPPRSRGGGSGESRRSAQWSLEPRGAIFGN